MFRINKFWSIDESKFPNNELCFDWSIILFKSFESNHSFHELYLCNDMIYFFSHFDEYLAINDQEDLNQKKTENLKSKDEWIYSSELGAKTKYLAQLLFDRPACNDLQRIYFVLYFVLIKLRSLFLSFHVHFNSDTTFSTLSTKVLQNTVEFLFLPIPLSSSILSSNKTKLKWLKK